MTDQLTRLAPQVVAAAVAATVLAACSDATGTAVRLDVTYEAAWSLDRLDLRVGETPTSTAASRTIVLLLPDEWAGVPLPISVVGMRGSERYAAADVSMTPELGHEIRATVVLTRLPCGAWCTPGTTTCMGDGVAVCAQLDSDSCLEWSTPVPCPAPAPACSLGVCAATCIDECAPGETRCDGPHAEATCGNADSDACHDWATPVACRDGETCSNGHCRGTCTDECALDATRCQGNGVATCGDLDHDGCLEWGPPVGCDSGTTCSHGACAASCTDDCTTSVCDGDAYRTCGDFDLDPCKDLSAGTSCVPADPCTVGACTTTGCTTTPRVCNAPPEATCVDDSTLRTYDPIGTCTTGACTYPPHDVVCAGSCTGGACTCTTSTEAVDSTGDVGADTSLAVDTGGGVHVAYGDNTNNVVKYAFRSAAGAWTMMPGPPVGDTSFFALAVDRAGGVHVAATSGQLRYAFKPPGQAWTTTTVGSGTVIFGTSIAVDGAAGVHISYYVWASPDAGALLYAYKAAGGAWSTTTVDATGDVGSASSVAVDSAGGVHIAYYDTTDADLKYAFKPPGGSWTTTTVDSAGTVGGSMSLKVNAAGVHVSYRDTTNTNLKYAVKPTTGAWMTITVDSTGDVGQSSSLAVDAAGAIHVTYRDATNADLKYAFKPAGGPWATRTVDSAGSVGADTSVAVDGAGRVHASYHDATNLDLKHARICP